MCIFSSFLLFCREFSYINCIFSDDSNKEKYNDWAKSVCKLEHGFMLGHDIVKEAAKQTTVETFDQVMSEEEEKKHPIFFQ